MLYQNGTLILVGGSSVAAIDPENGKSKWNFKLPRSTYKGFIVTGDNKLIYQGVGKPPRIVCIDLKSKKTLWDVPGPSAKRYLYSAETLFITTSNSFHAYSAKDGKLLWEKKASKWSHPKGRNCAFFVNGLLWTQDRSGGIWTGRDPKTGEEKKRLVTPKEVGSRCSPAQATSRYFIDSSNVLMENATGKVDYVPAARSGCNFGWFAANGMVYSVPTGCGCYPMLRGLMGFGPENWRQPDQPTREKKDRIQKGPAYGTTPRSELRVPTSEWPMFRHDPGRSGATSETVEEDITLIWNTQPGDSVTAPVAAYSMVYAASPDTHQLFAFEAQTGKQRWSFTAGARVDMPPTLYNGLVFFGSRDGWVYCVRASDGQLVWRFLAAPEERYIGGYEQLESAWPAHSSVLVVNGKVYFGSGRNSELDGGINVYALDPVSGKTVWHTCVYKRKFHGRKASNSTRIVLKSPLISTGSSIAMHSLKIDLKTGKESIKEYSRIWHRFSCGAAHSSIGKFNLHTKKPKSRKNGKNTYWLMGVPAKGDPWSFQFECAMNTLILAGEKVIVGGPVTGTEKGTVMIFNALTGKKITSMEIPAKPVPGGLAVADSRLFVSTADGRLLCFVKK
jgi:outer membrane protein assembly factor BamB